MQPHSDLKSRIFDVWSLDSPTRRVVWVGYALLLGIAASAAVRDLLPARDVHVDPGYLVPLVVVAVAGATLCAAVALLTAGTALARSRWRHAGLAVLFLLAAGLVFVTLGQPVVIAPAALVFVIAGAALVIFGRVLRWQRALALSAALVAFVAAMVLVEGAFGRETYPATAVFMVLAVLVVIVTPVLIVVGWDFAEIAFDVTAAVLKRDGAPLDSTVFVPVLLAGASLATGLWLGAGLSHTSLATLALRATALGIVVGAFVRHAARRPPASATPQTEGVRYFLMLAIGAVIVVNGWAAVVFTVDRPGAFNFDAGREFSVLLPPGWEFVRGSSSDPADARRSGDAPIKAVFAPKTKGLPRVVVAAFPRDLKSVALPTAVNDVEGGDLFERIPFRFDAACGCGEASVKNKRGTRTFRFTWRRVEIETGTPSRNANWYLIMAAVEGSDAKLAAEGQGVLDSFRLPPRTVAEPRVHVLTNEIFWMLLAALAVVFGTRGTKRRPVWDFVALASIVIAVRNFGTAGQTFHNMNAADAAELSAGILAAALIAAAVALLGGAVWAFRSQGAQARLFRATAVSFLGALLILALVFALYVYAAKGSEFSHALRGAVICLALTWEFWTSGALITNHDSTAFPRRARILFFLGYIALIATIVFFFGKLRYAALNVDQLPFESELYVAAGMACLGVPFLIFRHAQRFAAAFAPRTKA